MLRAYVLRRQTEQAIRQANLIARESGRKQLVLLFKGRPIVVSKQRLKQLIRQRKFNKGVKIADLERAAIFVTP